MVDLDRQMFEGAPLEKKEAKVMPSCVQKPCESFKHYIDRVWDGDLQKYLRNHKERIREAWREFDKIHNL